MQEPETPGVPPQVTDESASPSRASTPPLEMTDAAPESTIGTIARLRTEGDHTSGARKARLLYEVGELEEAQGQEGAAERDYLTALGAAPEFREPLEALLRTLPRRHGATGVGKLLEALVSVADTADERARALTLKAAFLDEVEKDLEGARDTLREATESSASAAELGATWLLLERVAAKLGDPGLRQEALAGRASLAEDPTWGGLLLVDVARIAAESGETEGAIELLQSALAQGGRATYLARGALYRLLRRKPGSPGSPEARTRASLLAQLLEAEGEDIARSVGDAQRALELGIPHFKIDPIHAVDLLMRAADLRRAARDYGRAATLLERATAVLDAAVAGSPEGGPEAELSLTRGVLLDARIHVAEMVGDTGLAAQLARDGLAAGAEGGKAAALAMRIAEEAAGEGNVGEALKAVTLAVAKDPLSIPARALELDLLADGSDQAEFASRLSSFAEHYSTAEAKSRTALLVAFLRATRVGDVPGAKEALGTAASHGAPPSVVARMARILASVRGDAAWYEEATSAMLAASVDEDEAALLGFELVRARLARGDEPGTQKALEELAGREVGALLSRALVAFLPGAEESSRPFAELAVLLGGRPGALGFELIAALRGLRGRGLKDALERISRLSSAEPENAFLSTLRLELERQSGVEPGEIARLVEATARSAADGELAASLHIEAGLERYRLGRADEALASFEAAAQTAPEATTALRAWAMRGTDLETPQNRALALARALASTPAAPELALECFANGLRGGRLDEAREGLDVAQASGEEGLALAGSLGRLAWDEGLLETRSARSASQATDDALRRIAALGPEGATFAAAERTRLARARGPEELGAAAQAWFSAGGGLAAGLEWLSASMTGGDGASEIAAREAIAGELQDEAREGMAASARLLELLLDPSTPRALLDGSSPATRLANFELAPPGSDPRRRAAAMEQLGDVFGPAFEAEKSVLEGWSTYVVGNREAAAALFHAAATSRPEDLAAWEGLRACAIEGGDTSTYAMACEELGARASGAARGALYWEQAGLAWIEMAQDARADAALDQAVHRDPSRLVAFDKLFRRMRDRKDSDKVLELIDRRLGHTDDSDEIAKLYWEQARALREKGDIDGALYSLENVRTLEPDHVGALALMGEIFIRRGRYVEAAEHLSRLARIEAAPAKNRVTAGIAAVDLFENKLGRPDAALDVLSTLHAAKLSTLPVRERLARTAARTGAWEAATSILEELMMERAEPASRIEAARLAVLIYRDRIRAPARAARAVAKLLDEAPTDGEAIDLVVEADIERSSRRALLERAKGALLASLNREPGQVEVARRLARVCRTLGDGALEHASLSIALALGGPDGSSEQMLAHLSASKPRSPQLAMTDTLLRRILAPGDDGPLAQLFTHLGPTLAEALGPSLFALGVTKKERVDPRGGVALRNEIAAWAGAFEIAEFDLYIGGKDPMLVQSIPGDPPSLVIGSAVTSPLSPESRGRIARELLATRRGTVITRWRDATTIAAIVVAACNITKVRIESPVYAVLAEVERLMSKAISRRTRNAIEPVCQVIAQQPRDAKAWVARAIASQHRISAIASGDASVVLADAFGLALPELGRVAREDLRCAELFRFVLSPDYFEIRRLLGLEGGA